MRYFRYVFLFALIVSGLLSRSQIVFPSDYFRAPLDIPMYLSGTFGELRSNHFHAGIDIKTQGVEGLKVYAVADGYISRIKVSLWGYGNVIYITHPNGFVSVYGHLQKFNKEISRYVRENQYKRKSFVIELYPEKDLLKVKKGEVIAFSGNTGGSMGPHLHFEIRDAANQHPLNPLLFKSIKIKDKSKPVIAELAVYPVDDTSVINDKTDTLFLKVHGRNGQFMMNDSIKVHGRIAFGLRAYDRMDDINNKNGIYEEQLFVDSALVFDVKFNELSFYTSRYINSLMDYRYLQKAKRKLIRTELDTNNRLAVYRTIENNGIFTFTDTLTHQMEYVVKDAYGNTSRFPINIKGYSPDTIIKSSDRYLSADTTIFVGFSKKLVFNWDSLSVSFPANTFYRGQPVGFGKETAPENSYSSLYKIGNRFVPLQKYCLVSLKLNKQVPDSLLPALYVAKADKNDMVYFSSGKPDGDQIKFKTRVFGNYTVMLDTVPPVIKPVNFKDGKNVTGQKNIRVVISDKQTGIKRYGAFLNDKWILMEYNPKKALLTYRFDWLMKKGKNHLKLYVFDNCDNETVYEADLVY